MDDGSEIQQHLQGQVQHVFSDFHVFNFIEVFVFGADLIRIAQKRSDQPLTERFKANDVFAA